MAPVINVFRENNFKFDTKVAVTAQHREMLDPVLSLFKIMPDFDLDLMSNNQSLEVLTGKIINGVSSLLKNKKPDIVFVQGDTTTTFAAALSSYYNKIPVAHIEAGLRSNNNFSPFPEEINRKMTSTIASFHFPPTEQSYNNLLKDGISIEKIKITGNTVIDVLINVLSEIDSTTTIYENYFFEEFKIDFNIKKTILVTGHRRENFGEGFENICIAIKHIAENNNVQFIYPLHLNPNVLEPVNRILGKVKNVFLIPPQEYIPFVFLMKNSYIVLTDSGGVQEEAPTLGKPVLVMRDTTERQEGINAGTAKLIGTNSKNIIAELDLLLNKKIEYNKMSKAINPYGDGNASKKIFDFISEKF